MDSRVHFLASYKQDTVTGTYKTRCGLVGMKDMRMLPGYDMTIFDGERRNIAFNEKDVTCKHCKLKIGNVMKKVLRLLYDKPRRITLGNKFQFNDSVIYVTDSSHRKLEKLCVLSKLDSKWRVGSTLRTLAADLPKVEEEF